MNRPESEKFLAEIQCSKSFCDGYPVCLMTHRNPNKNRNTNETSSTLLQTSSIHTPIENSETLNRNSGINDITTLITDESQPINIDIQIHNDASEININSEIENTNNNGITNIDNIEMTNNNTDDTPSNSKSNIRRYPSIIHSKPQKIKKIN